MNPTLPTLATILTLLFLTLISADIANLTFYGVWIGAGPDAIITKVRFPIPPSSPPRN
jgi:hypothetical protein